MDKIKDMMHGGHKKEGEHATTTHDPAVTTTAGGYGQPGVAHPTEGAHEKKGLFGFDGHKKEGEEGGKKKHGILGGGKDSSSSSSSDEEREGAKERNRVRREKRAQRHAGAGNPGATTTTGQMGTFPVEGAEKKHGFFG